ncbi:MAG: RHS repeat protein [Armatimonadetes bacterium]|nr:MAG: RHS repeat protein [Armatimonadota bacterium]
MLAVCLAEIEHGRGTQEIYKLAIFCCEELGARDECMRLKRLKEATGRRTTMMLGNGTTRKYQFDNWGQLTTQIEYSGATPLCTIVDGYDPVGNRGTRNLDGNPVSWSYDDLYRLTGQAKAGQVCTYTLDGVGNLKTMWEGGAFPRTFTHDPADRLVTMIEGVKVTTYSYTGYGALEIEQTPTGHATHTYSGQDQLVGTVSGSGLAVSRSTYTFGGDGLRRTAQNGNVQPTTMVWDGADYLLLNGPITNQVVLTIGSEIVSCGDFDLLPDSLGSVIGDTRAGFDPRLLYEYWPFGMISASVIRAMLPFHYVGSLGYYNDSADRDYVRARELMKKLGTWMQLDAFWPEERGYQYGRLRPTVLRDRSGDMPDATERMANEAVKKACWVANIVLALEDREDVYGEINDCVAACNSTCQRLTRKMLLCLSNYACGRHSIEFNKGDCCGSNPPCAYVEAPGGIRQGGCTSNPKGVKIFICKNVNSAGCNPLGTGVPITDAVIHEILHCCGLKHGGLPEPRTCNSIMSCCILKKVGINPPRHKCC